LEFNIKMIHKYNDKKPFKTIFKEDNNKRKINCYKLNNVVVNNNLYYPDVLCCENKSGKVFDPIDEKIMSLGNLNFQERPINNNNAPNQIEKNPVFYFIYNTENYYHFLYDTLPYLISYYELSKTIPELKILMNWPNSHKKELFLFVKETLDLLGLQNKVILLDKNTLYKEVYISDSYTHGIDSNLPPREEIYDFFIFLKNRCLQHKTSFEYPRKFYVSRRSWIHNNLGNIGTNYTNRRVMKNETLLVQELEKKGYTEIFTENLSMIEKILLFSKADSVVGIIGGGLVNSIFMPRHSHLFAIESPYFLEINSRFIYCLNRQNLNLIKATKHSEETEFKRFMRVSFDGKYGEIYDIDGDYLKINHSLQRVAGWSSAIDYNKTTIHKSKCKKLDKGLNSAFTLNLEKCLNKIK